MTKGTFSLFRNTLNLAAGIALGAAVLVLSAPGSRADTFYHGGAPTYTKIGFKYGGHGFHGSRFHKSAKGHRFNRHYKKGYFSGRGHHGRFVHRGYNKKRYHRGYHRSFHPRFSFGFSTRF